MLYTLIYDFLSTFVFADPLIPNRDVILHWMSFSGCVLILFGIYWGVRAVIKAITGDDGRRRRWL